MHIRIINPNTTASMTAKIEAADAEAVVQGCAGMADLATWLTAETGIPVIDGVAAATTLMEAICGLGLRTCKAGAYGFAFAKPFRGVMVPHAYTEA